MKTDDLIDALAAGLEPAKPAMPSPVLLAAAAVAAVAAVGLFLGFRPDLGQALQGPIPWLKGIYTAALAGTGIWLAIRLGRPGVDPRPAVFALLAVVAAAGLWGLIEMSLTSPEQRMDDWLGGTWTICGRNIVLVSAFAGHDTIRAAYAHAIAERYRFFSYGDAMLLRRADANEGPARAESTG